MSMTLETLSDKLGQQAKAAGVPVWGQFELTSRCNLRCKMCYVCQSVNNREAVAKERSAGEWIKLAEEARDAGMLYLLLTGGEVFVRKDLKEIYEELSMLGLRITLYTNATLVTPQVIKWLKRTPPAVIEVTLYGASAETYGKVCGDADGFDRAIRGIDLMLAEGLNLKVKTTVIKDNAKDYEKILEIAGKRDLILRYCHYISPRRDVGVSRAEEHRLEPNELAEYFFRASQDFAEKTQGYRKDNQLADDNHMQNTACEENGHPFKCLAGKCNFWVTWDGRMTPCGLMGTPSSSPFETGFDKAWNELKNACSAIPACSECLQCTYKEYCMACPARLKSETGSYERPSSYLCEYARHWKSILNQHDVNIQNWAV